MIPFNLHNVFTSRVSGRGYNIGPVCPSVCLCVCLSFSSLTPELFDVRTQVYCVANSFLGKQSVSTDMKGTMREGHQRSGVFIL